MVLGWFVVLLSVCEVVWILGLRLNFWLCFDAVLLCGFLVFRVCFEFGWSGGLLLGYVFVRVVWVSFCFD